MVPSSQLVDGPPQGALVMACMEVSWVHLLPHMGAGLSCQVPVNMTKLNINALLAITRNMSKGSGQRQLSGSNQVTRKEA